MLIAFVDESCRIRNDDDCVYTLAAVLVREADIPEVRSTMDHLRFGKAPIVHWRTERPERRRLIAHTVATLGFTSVVAVCIYEDVRKPERARRMCLAKLLSHLSGRDVSAVVFESRRAQDASDRAILTVLRKTHQVRPSMSVTWIRSSADAALWTADVVAGIVTQWLDGSSDYWRLFESHTTLLDARS